jgi:hypothetical protein
LLLSEAFVFLFAEGGASSFLWRFWPTEGSPFAGADEDEDEELLLLITTSFPRARGCRETSEFEKGQKI